jgi:predicted RNase H-like HicB family nuclease
MRTFIAILSKEKRSDYGVHFPDLPGCVTAGRTLEEARKRAAEALALHLDGMAEEGLPIPEPSSLDRIVKDPSSVEGVPFLVTAAEPESRVVRVNITLPADVLERIDSYVEKTETSRSAFLAAAALRSIGTAAQPGRSRKSKRAA